MTTIRRPSHFAATTAAGKGESLYLVAKGGQSTASKSKGDNPAIALLTVLGSQAPDTVTINQELAPRNRHGATKHW